MSDARHYVGRSIVQCVSKWARAFSVRYMLKRGMLHGALDARKMDDVREQL